jgi:anthraniloyl-CoA monooxygenase
MEDAIVLRDELLGARDSSAALAAYEARRRPEVEALQAAAQASLEWFEGTERYARMAPVQFTYSLMTRSLRVSHASVAKRDPHLARGVEQLLAASLGVSGEPPPPTALPFALGDRRARSRIAFVYDAAAKPGTPTLGGAGLVVTAPLALQPDRPSSGIAPGIAAGSDRAPAGGSAPVPGGSTRSVTDASSGELLAWEPIVDRVHQAGALIVARLAVGGCALDTVASGVARAAAVGFDLVLLDAGGESAADAVEALPAAVAAARTAWRPGGWIAAVVHDRPAARAAVIGHAAQLVRAGTDMLWVSAPSGSLTHGARLPAAPLADRLRNELGVATAIECGDALLPDLEAAIAAGRADLVVVARLPEGAGSTVQRS